MRAKPADDELLDYDICGVLKIRADPRLRRMFYFTSGPSANTHCDDLCIIRCEDRVTVPARSVQFYGSYFGTSLKDEVFLNHRVAGVRMQLGLRNLMQKTTELSLNDSYRRFGGTIIGMDVRPPNKHITNLILVRLLQRGFTLIHAAAVAKNGEAMIICAPPETGKSVTSFKLASDFGYDFMSDDVAVFGQQKLFSTIPRTALTPSMCRLYNPKLGLSKRERVYMFGLMSRAGRALKLNHLLGFAPTVEVNMMEILGQNAIDVCEQASVKMICFIERGGNEAMPLSPQESYAKLVALNRAEFEYHHDNVLLCYSYFNPSFRIDELLRAESILLREATENANSWLVRSASADGFAKLISEL